MEFKLRVAQNFGQAAEHYDKHAIMQAKAAAFLASLVNEHVNYNVESALEIGAGTGLFTEPMIKQYPDAKWTLNDIAAQMLDRLAMKIAYNPNIRYLHADAEEIEFKENQYDFICSSTVFQWIENLDAFLAKLGNASKILAFNMLAASNLPQVERVTNKLLSVPQIYDLVYRSLPEHNLIIVPQKVSMTFKNSAELLRNMRNIGAHTCKESRKLSDLIQFIREFKQQFSIEHEILHIIAKKQV